MLLKPYVKMNSSTMLLAVLKGLTVAVLMTALSVAICAKTVAMAVVSENSAGYCAIALTAISALTGVLAAKCKEKRIYTAAIIGLLYIMVLLSITAVFFGGQYMDVGISLISVAAGCILGILLLNNSSARVRSRRSKRMFR